MATNKSNNPQEEWINNPYTGINNLPKVTPQNVSKPGPNIGDYAYNTGKYITDSAGITSPWGWGGLQGDAQRAYENNYTIDPTTGEYKLGNIYNPFNKTARDYWLGAGANILTPAALAAAGWGRAGLAGAKSIALGSRAADIYGTKALPTIGKTALNTFGKQNLFQKALTLGSPILGFKMLTDTVANAVNDKYKSPVTTQPQVDPYAAANRIVNNTGIGSQTFWDTYKKYNPKGAMEAVNQDWATNGIGSANFNKAYDAANPVNALKRQIEAIQLDPIRQAQYSQQQRSIDESYNDLLNQLETSDKNAKLANEYDINASKAQTTGSNAQILKELASAGMSNSIGQGDNAVNAGIRQGNIQQNKINAYLANILSQNKLAAAEAGTKAQEDRNALNMQKTQELLDLRKQLMTGAKLQ